MASKGTDHLLVVLTKGDLSWDRASGALSPDSTAWNPELREVFPDEPKYVDLAWAQTDAGLTLRNARFRDQIATLAAAIRATPKEEIEGEDVRQQLRTRRVVRAVIAALTVLVLLASFLAVLANVQRQQAVRESQIALSRQLAAEGLSIDRAHPVIARRLAVAALRVFPTYQARSVLTTLVRRQQQQGLLPADASIVFGVAFSPDGKLLAIVGGDGTARLWDTATGHPVGPPLHTASRTASVSELAFSPDGRLLATVSGKGTVRLWDPVTGRAVGAPLKASTNPAVPGVDAITFDPAGWLLASANFQVVRLWDPLTRRSVGLPISLPQVSQIAFSPQGNLLAGIGTDPVRLWQMALFSHPYSALCAEVGQPTRHE